MVTLLAGVVSGDLTALCVTAVEEPEAYALLLECSLWLRNRGVPQWTSPYPRDRFARDVSGGKVRLWRSGGQAIATATVSTQRPAYYPSEVWADAERACYVCRLAVSRAHARAGLGTRVLAELEREARETETAALRLDVAAANPFLRAYYEAHGFAVVARAQLMGDDALFMEKRIT